MTFCCVSFFFACTEEKERKKETSKVLPQPPTEKSFSLIFLLATINCLAVFVFERNIFGLKFEQPLNTPGISYETDYVTGTVFCG